MKTCQFLQNFEARKRKENEKKNDRDETVIRFLSISRYQGMRKISRREEEDRKIAKRVPRYESVGERNF